MIRAVLRRVPTRPRFTTLDEVHAHIDALDVLTTTRKRYRAAINPFWDWGVRARRLPAQTPAQKLPAAWELALTRFADAQSSKGHTDAVIARRARCIRGIALSTGLRPNQLTLDAAALHLEQAALSKTARATSLGAARAFLRWGVEAKLVQADAAVSHHRTAPQGLALTWDSEIRHRGLAMRALGLSEQTVRTRTSQMVRLARLLPDVHPYDVTTDQLIGALGKIQAASETRHGILAAARTHYDWAVLVGHTDDNPARRVPAIRVDVKVVRPATDDEYTLAAAKGTDDDRFALAMLAGLGLRIGELAGTRAQDVRGTAGDYWLKVDGKGRKERELPISDALVHLLRSRGDWAFPGHTGGHITPGALSRRISALLPPGVTAHKLRHRFGDRAYAANRDLLAVQTLLGHSSPTVTRRYVRTDGATLRATADAVRQMTPGAL